MREKENVSENSKTKQGFFKRHKKATICIIVILILGMIGSCEEESNQKEDVVTIETTAELSAVQNGTYTGENLGLEKHSGKLVFDTGDSYDGEWNKEVIDGNGKYLYQSIGEYEGQFVDGQRFGDGKFVWEDGSTYVGKWENDKINGEGTYTSANGSILIGTFSDNKFMSGKAKNLRQHGKMEFVLK